MKCVYCDNEHDGSFGSGRFCNKKCASGFSTKNKRQEINNKVRLKSLQKGSVQTDRLNTKESREKRKQTMIERYGSTFFLSEENRKKNIDIVKKLKHESYLNKTFDELSRSQKRRRLIEERGHTCEWCRLSTWRDQKIQIELDHIDGNKINNSIENLRLLCPNCHAQTPTWRKKKNKVDNRLELSYNKAV